MKWKTALTAEEAALISTGLQRFKTFREVKTWVSGQKSIIGDQGTFIDNHGFPNSTRLQMELNSAEDAFYEAEEIKEGLNLEIKSAWTRMEYGENVGSSLFIYSVTWTDEQSDALALKGCTVLKESLAWWFYEMGDIDKAKIFDPNFDPKNDFRDEAAELKNSPVNKATTLSPKTKNSYLKVIQALSKTLLTKGLTGKDSSDARLILQRLSSNGVEAPIGKEALAKYLKEARELP